MAAADTAGAQGTVAGFDAALGPVLDPELAATADHLAAVAGLGASERAAVLDGLARALTSTVLNLVSRLLVLELNAARVTGRLRAADAAARWAEFLDLAAEEPFWRTYLPAHYPTLLPRLQRLVRGRCAAAVALAGRFAADRDAIGTLTGEPPGELAEVGVGAGDSHGGHTVCLVRCTGGDVVYKPRPLDTDLALSALLAAVRDGAPSVLVDVPAVVARGGYGWARRVRHRHCADDAELRQFYRGIGHWLAVAWLLGGTDLHAENLVACGPVPVVVDCETLFTPYQAPGPSGLGAATDEVIELVRAVLRTRLLPARRTGGGAGAREDGSAAGNLPGQQPAVAVPAILDGGTDTARLGTREGRPRRAVNHPSATPAPDRYWPHVVDGLDDVTDRLRALDATGELDRLLDRFRGCRVRVVARNTARYSELAWMLWHPVSLHDEPAAVRRATALLTAAPDEPRDPVTVAAEIEDLLVGDVPVFTTAPGGGPVDGPRGTRHGTAADLVADALHRWRGADRDRVRDAVRASIVSAYLDTPWRPDDRRPARATRRAEACAASPAESEATGPEPRRRALAAELVRRVRDAAVLGADGTACWVTPVLGPGGWSVHAAGPDLYGGAPGIAVMLAGYLGEVEHGRAEPVDGLPELLARTLRTVRLREDREAALPHVRLLPGAYLGIGGRIWSWLTLAALGRDGGDGIARAAAIAERLARPDRLASDPTDVFTGLAGAVVPLLRLAEATGQPRWTDLARAIGRRLVPPDGQQPGFPRGATGVAWALARLAASTGDAAAGDAAAAVGRPAGPVAAWCHGAVGIGIAAADLLHRSGDERHRRTLREAAAAGWATGLGHNSTLCHGDLGTWELLDAALRHGAAPPGLDRTTLVRRVLDGLDAGPVLTHGDGAPGLLTGLGGVAYQLLRMHPGCALPSVLLPG